MSGEALVAIVGLVALLVVVGALAVVLIKIRGVMEAVKTLVEELQRRSGGGMR